ncbi:MAG TPA: hypothetical protein VHY37_10395 [Tepidisphaeraceae bacterium]|nr:hypothetical protein [Tepidisphaeraceae bacterium]
MSSTHSQSSVLQLLQERKREIKRLQQVRKKMERQMKKISAKLERLVEQQEAPKATQPWWTKIAGKFDNDVSFAQAIREGEKWRDSQRTKSGKRRARS